MYTNQALIRLWSNDQKRRGVVNDYKDWGVWFKQPELNLTFYKYDLPHTGRIVAIEFVLPPYPSNRTASGTTTGHKLYLQRGEYFIPNAASDSEIATRLMKLKAELMKKGQQ
jgi:hypothetical protein